MFLTHHLYLAEKPSLAEVLAKARATMLGTKAVKGSNAWTVGDDSFTWLRGHMYGLANPQDYEERYQRWHLDHLPIIPSKWKRSPHADKGAHLSAIRNLLKTAKVIVNAGDAEREGQLLVDELLEEMGYNPFSSNVRRVWVSSFAEKDLIKAINDLFPNSDKKNLYTAAWARQRADWLYGINLTRLYTNLARSSGAQMLISVGRVQTPTLKLVVDRDREIEAFKPTDHYLPTGFFKHQNGLFKADWIIPEDHAGLDSEGRLIDKNVAQNVLNKIMGKTGKVVSFSSTKKAKGPPLPYSLSSLQSECSSKLGLTAQETLDVAQALYETHKATTYPRSDSQYLPKTILNDEAPGIMAALANTDGLNDAAQRADLKLRSKAWDDAKVTDHHGIIPTSEFTPSKLARMSPVERSVFLLIAKAFIAQFHPDFTWKSNVAEVIVEGERFKASGRQVLDNGWKTVYGAEEVEDEDDKETDQNLPVMSKGDPVVAEKGDIASKRTQPPSFFTDGTLIAAMSNVHRFVEDPEVKKRLKDNDGIGTPATRANIIETLLLRKFLTRKGKTRLVSTPQGRSVVDALPDDVTSPGMTALWEAQLAKITRGEMTDDEFMSVLIRSLTKIVDRGKTSHINIKGASIEPLPGHGETCTKCGKGQMITRAFTKGENKGKRFMACDAWRKDDPNSCKNAVWPDQPKKEIKAMEGDGQVCPKCSKGHLRTRMIQKGDNKGRTFLACDNWSKDNKNSCDFVKWPEQKVKEIAGHGENCPECKKGKMTTRVIGKGDNKGKFFLSCSTYPDCKHAKFPEDMDAPYKTGGASARSSGRRTMSFDRRK